MQYDLVFEGGGAKGMAFVGAMTAFEEAGHTPGRLLGTSAGAITATLLAAGYTAAEMQAALAERVGERSVFAGFMGMPLPMDKAALDATALRALLRDLDLPFVPDRYEESLDDKLTAWFASNPTLRHVFSFVENGGWYSADSFVAWMGRCLDTGTFRGEPRAFRELTLAQFKERTGSDLTLVASDLTDQKMLILNHVTAPDVPVVWAVRMSMNIPLLWQEVIWQPEWKQYRGRAMAGHSIVDGGLLSNFPLELFTSKLEGMIQLMGSSVAEGLIGVLIDEALPIEGLDAAAAPSSVGLRARLLPVEQRLSNLVNTALSGRDKLVIEEFEKLLVRLPARGIRTDEFDMSEKRRELLVAAGHRAMEAYLTQLPEDGMDFPDASVLLEVSTDCDAAAEPPNVSMGFGDAAPPPDRTQLAADRLAQRFLND
ncbi:MAG: hypothetical protein JWM10_2775 [Myxococcaceae bacterium]|nr:hypothetical protein [Myxococcaceae bacterium]